MKAPQSVFVKTAILHNQPIDGDDDLQDRALRPDAARNHPLGLEKPKDPVVPGANWRTDSGLRSVARSHMTQNRRLRYNELYSDLYLS